VEGRGSHDQSTTYGFEGGAKLRGKEVAVTICTFMPAVSLDSQGKEKTEHFDFISASKKFRMTFCLLGLGRLSTLGQKVKQEKYQSLVLLRVDVYRSAETAGNKRP
jgi:hypothetical protein